MTETLQSVTPDNASAAAQLKPWLGKAIGAVGFGSGISVAIAAIAAVKAHPEMLKELTGPNVLIFATAAIGLGIYSRASSKNSDINLRNATSNERVAQSLQKLADKDDQRAREQDILLNHVAAQNQLIITQYENIGKRYEDIGSQLAAIRRDQEQAHS